VVRRFPAVVLLVVGLLSCRGPQQIYTSLGRGAEPLKAQFNRDAGRTRIVLLPAPT
jgi:hypothetical protein